MRKNSAVLFPRHQAPEWVLVADEGGAKTFLKSGGKLEFLTTIFPVTGPLDGMDNASIGRVASPTGRRSKYEPPPQVSRQKEIQFAQEICFWINEAAERAEFARLTVAAPPRMLGLLRPRFSREAWTRVIAEIDKDLTHKNIPELEKELRMLEA